MNKARTSISTLLPPPRPLKVGEQPQQTSKLSISSSCVQRTMYQRIMTLSMNISLTSSVIPGRRGGPRMPSSTAMSNYCSKVWIAPRISVWRQVNRNQRCCGLGERSEVTVLRKWARARSARWTSTLIRSKEITCWSKWRRLRLRPQTDWIIIKSHNPLCKNFRRKYSRLVF